MWSAASAIVARGAGLACVHASSAVFTAAASLGNCLLNRSCSAVCSWFHAATFGDRKPGTNVTITTPPFFGSICRTLSGTLRGTSFTARADECEKITGACETRIASSIVSGDTCERSTSMPSQFISRTTSSPNGDSPLELRRVGRRVGPRDVLRVRERHVARAEPVEHAQRAERAVDRVAALHADERRDLPLLEDPLDVVGRERQLERLGILAHHAMDDVDLLERGGDRDPAWSVAGT